MTYVTGVPETFCVFVDFVDWAEFDNGWEIISSETIEPKCY